MPEPIPQQKPQPVLLDRLSRNKGMGDYDNQDLKQSILRDLTWLLGTIALDANPRITLDCPRLKASVLNYGIPELFSELQKPNNLSVTEQALAQAIKNFEPRIIPSSLKVRITSRSENSDTLSSRDLDTIHISGLLWSEPQHLEFSLVRPLTALEPSTE